MDDNAVNSLWAKRSRDEDDASFHPLICHLIDVAAVAAALWDQVMSTAARRWIAYELGVDETAAGGWIALVAGLHDIGKANPGFQEQRSGADPHGTVSAVVLEELLKREPFRLEPLLSRQIAVVVGGHHGVIPRSDAIQHAQIGASYKPGRGWAMQAEMIVALMAEHVGLPDDRLSTLSTAGAMWLAGFVSVADWIGSNDDFFTFSAPDGVLQSRFALDDYVPLSRARAERALRTLGWTAKPQVTSARTFRELFPKIEEPNDLQQRIEEIARWQTEPWIVIIEAPMGEGKTEAGFFVADQGMVKLGMQGSYIALPTQATSNQMFLRLKKFLTNRYDENTIQLQLLHGQAGLSAEFEELTKEYQTFLDRINMPDFESENCGYGDTPAAVLASAWFTNRKRRLLSPFGIGTVDQALLAVLQTRHVFVRLFGLAGKTVIIDEVHAYDTYMTTLLERLISWLAALGCTVVLLSATLPAARRDALLRAYQLGEMPESEPLKPAYVPYPRITWASGGDCGSAHIETSTRSSKTVEITWLAASDDWRDDLARRLQMALAGGGCAAVICNTVKSAQETYLALKQFFPNDELDLFHARFLATERADREERVLRKFGEPDDPTVVRPNVAVVVATQVIEQSLDLDFDLMVTELAPVDLVLQRAGRLHRHERDSRPDGLARANLWIVGPPEEDGIPNLTGPAGYFYDHHILLRSWLALRERERIVIPGEVEALIESAYGDDAANWEGVPLIIRTRLDETRTKLDDVRGFEQTEAERRWIKPPFYSGHLSRVCADALEEESPETHQAFQALTRLSEPTMQLIFLRVLEDGRIMHPDGLTPFRSSETPSLEQARRLLRQAVTVSGWKRVKALQEELIIPSGWKKSAVLSHAYVVPFDPATGRSRTEQFLKLDGELGLLFDDLRNGEKGGEG